MPLSKLGPHGSSKRFRTHRLLSTAQTSQLCRRPTLRNKAWVSDHSKTFAVNGKLVAAGHVQVVFVWCLLMGASLHRDLLCWALSHQVLRLCTSSTEEPIMLHQPRSTNISVQAPSCTKLCSFAFAKSVVSDFAFCKWAISHNILTLNVTARDQQRRLALFCVSGLWGSNNSGRCTAAQSVSVTLPSLLTGSDNSSLQVMLQFCL